MVEDRTEGFADRAANDDSMAFEELVLRVHGRLSVWVSLRMGPVLRGRLAVDDVVQETLIHAHRSVAQFQDRGPGSFQRWLFALAENRLRDLQKFHSAQRRDPARERSSDELAFLQRIHARTSTPSAKISRKERVERLVQGIGRLPEEERELVIMRALEDRTFKDIAESTGERQAVVVATYGRALQQLKRDLAALDD